MLTQDAAVFVANNLHGPNNETPKACFWCGNEDNLLMHQKGCVFYEASDILSKEAGG